MKLTLPELVRRVDLSTVRADVGAEEVRALCAAACQYGCAAVSILPCYTAEARRLLRNHPEICLDGNVGFPSGAELTSIKVAQAQALVDLGCGELDMVMNIGWLRSGRDAAVEEDIRAVVEASEGRPVKVILETVLLTEDEIRRACKACLRAGAAFVKTGTGWASRPTTVEHVRLIRSLVGERAGIKASGGIRDITTVAAMFRAGATRFGFGFQTGLHILEEWATLPDQAFEVEEA